MLVAKVKHRNHIISILFVFWLIVARKTGHGLGLERMRSEVREKERENMDQENLEAFTHPGKGQ